MGKQIMDRTGAVCLLVTILVAKMFTPQPRMVAEQAGSAAWLVVLLTGPLSLLGYWGLSALLVRFPGLSIAQISLKALGRVAGAVVGILYAAYFIWMGGVMLREFVAGFRVAVLPSTPVSVLAMGILVIGLYAAVKGPEVQARLAAYLIPGMAVLLAITVVGVWRLLDWRQLTPVFGYSLRNTLLLSFPLTSKHSEILVLGVLAPLLPTASVRRLGLSALLAGYVGQVLFLLFLGSVFPFPAMSRLFYPMLELTRMIEVSEFIQRIEALFIFLWFFVAAFAMATLITTIASIIRDVTETTLFNPFALSASLLMFTIAFIPFNQVELMWLDWLTLRTWGWAFSFGLPILTLAVAVLRGKRGENGETPETRAG
ncbi:MAG TPA: GerAB/ArcD/ProY family transporter [Symbiobacteriaceae bacterium]|nr:GerAB/ArcD/ProY family transporter [Symbiobacteriaceae bacterium]